ncbi:hypothetical protein M5K25_019982 [Dendrobium thyrsiflorum]|uniref:Uncharacterized protein n=1 Tax=Dendrobium thyrsiflorum TaxID=117978 RepID=A0ABD0UN89_DENTH
MEERGVGSAVWGNREFRLAVWKRVGGLGTKEIDVLGDLINDDGLSMKRRFSSKNRFMSKYCPGFPLVLSSL